MKIDIGESLVSSYLRHVKSCSLVQINWKPSGNWVPDPVVLREAVKEFDRIQHHPAFTEIFKTGFDPTLKQTEVDVMAWNQQEDTIYAANVTFHEYGINFGAKTDTRNRVIKNLLRAHLAMNVYFPGKKHVLMFCSPKVSPVTEEIISDYFKILESDFTSGQTRFMYISNDNFRDSVLMETIDCIQDEFDTSELFLRSFKLMTIYAGETPEETPAEESATDENATEKNAEPEAETVNPTAPASETPQENIQSSAGEVQPGNEGNEKSEEQRTKVEVNKVINRVPKWFQHPEQNNSKILINYMRLLEKSEVVTLDQLAEACSDVNKFTGNYAQMINMADKNHGRVFSGTNENVTLWEPVKDFIIQQYIEFKKSYYHEE